MTLSTWHSFWNPMARGSAITRFGGRTHSYLSHRKRVRRRYAKAFKRDNVLKGMTRVDDTLARFASAISMQRRLRRLQVQYQRIPVPMAVAGRVYAFRSRQRMEASARTVPGHVPTTKRAGPQSTLRTRMRSIEERAEDLDHPFER